MKKLLVVSAILAVVACTPFNPSEYLANRHNDLLMQGNSTQYADGYVDGCASGRKVAGDSRFIFSKNAKRFKADEDYSSGWEQGYQFCREERLNQIENEKVEAKADYYRTKTQRTREKMWNEMKK